MDTHESATDVARALNVKLPRLHRHASGRNVRTDGHRLVLGQSAVAALRERLGVLPPVEGLTRAQVQALVALSRRPRGLVSVRQVAKAARLSPTAASRALAKLMSLGLATRTWYQSRPYLPLGSYLVGRTAAPRRRHRPDGYSPGPCAEDPLRAKTKWLRTSAGDCETRIRLATSSWFMGWASGTWRKLNARTRSSSSRRRSATRSSSSPGSERTSLQTRAMITSFPRRTRLVGWSALAIQGLRKDFLRMWLLPSSGG